MFNMRYRRRSECYDARRRNANRQPKRDRLSSRQPHPAALSSKNAGPRQPASRACRPSPSGASAEEIASVKRFQRIPVWRHGADARRPTAVRSSARLEAIPGPRPPAASTHRLANRQLKHSGLDDERPRRATGNKLESTCSRRASPHGSARSPYRWCLRIGVDGAASGRRNGGSVASSRGLTELFAAASYRLVTAALASRKQ